MFATRVTSRFGGKTQFREKLYSRRIRVRLIPMAVHYTSSSIVLEVLQYS